MLVHKYSNNLDKSKIQIQTFKNRSQNRQIDTDLLSWGETSNQFWVSLEAPYHKQIAFDYADHVIENAATPSKGTMIVSINGWSYVYNYTLPTKRQKQTDNKRLSGLVQASIGVRPVDLSSLPTRIWKQFGFLKDGHAFRILFEKNSNIDQDIFRDDLTTEVYCYRIKQIVVD